MKHTTSVLLGPRIHHAGPSSLSAAIARQCAERPQAVAVSHGALRVSYAELGAQAARVRDALRAAGLRHAGLVPLITRGGPGMIAAMIGTWAAGGAFAPLAADGPADRRDLALGRIASGIALVDGPADAVPGWTCLDIGDLVSSREAAEPLDVDAVPAAGDLAYGFFTSGSTGVPKCCLNVHSGLVNRAQTMSRRFGLRAGEVVMQNSAHVFDSSLWQIFWPLSVGAEVMIPQRTGILDLDATLREIAERQVRMTDFVPSILEQLVQRLRGSAEARARMAALRFLLVGGEALSLRLLRDVSRLLPEVQLVNTYGPTEASIGMVFHLFDGQESRVPLGLPIDNTGLAVVDESLCPVPLGEIGEIVIGGACMGLGYLGEPERTAEVFRRDTGLPLGSDVVYRTGDLGHIGADGLLYFDGRLDDQVKIGGVRIEVGEIEHHMRGFEGIERAKVVPVETDGTTWLAGFYTAADEICGRALQAHLTRALGKGSVPSLLKRLDGFPTTVSGKVDGKALIAAHCAVTQAAPRSATDSPLLHRLLASAHRLLPGRRFGPDEDLADLGLGSLGALSLVIEAEQATGRSIGIGRFLARPRLTTLVGDEPAAAMPDEMPDEMAAIVHDVAEFGGRTAPPAMPARSDGCVVLTGATGYVGRALLCALLRQGASDVVCLVRAPDDEAATARLRAAIPDLPEERVRAIAADLAAPEGPLADWAQRLPHGTRAIVHAAADVNFSKPYRHLRASNPAATATLCALALARGARLHHVSSAAALGGGRLVPDACGDLPSDPEAAMRLDTGYARSKWVSEQVIAAFRARGLSAEIYRLGEMMPDAVHPDVNPLAAATLLCAAAAAIGAVVDLEEVTDLTPTGLVSDWIAVRCLSAATRDLSATLVHPMAVPLSRLFHAVLGPLPCLPLGAFRAALRERHAREPHPDLARALVLLPSDADRERGHRLFQAPALGPVLAGLPPLPGLVWPQTDPSDLARLLAPMRPTRSPAPISEETTI